MALMKHASAEERLEHYKKHNHRIHHEHTMEAAKKMDTTKMQCSRHAEKG